MDFNKNDIIIVLLILIAAALIIYIRINSIMDYPEKLAADAASSQAQIESTETTAPPATTESSAAAANKDITIEITDSDDSIAVATKLYQAGAVDSDMKFQNYIANMGKENSLKTGTFKIPAGSTDNEILDIITN